MLRATTNGRTARPAPNEGGDSDPRAILEAEHRLILRVVDALERWSAQVSQQRADARDELARFVAFFERFVDGVHHTREEELLFRALVRTDDARCTALVGLLLREHEHARDRLEDIARLAYQLHPWSPEDHDVLHHAIAGLVESTRQHIQRENRQLLPLVRECLASRDTITLADALERATDRGDHGLAWSLIERQFPRCEHVHRGVAPLR